MIEQSNKKNLPIGVFDSGMGGLTVLKALQRALPHESFLYLGDTARLPYGTKSQFTVVQYAIQMAEILREKGIKLLVVACNTASTAALEALKKNHPDIPVIGVIEPGARAAVNHAPHKKILVLATETTIRSNIYADRIKALDEKFKVSGRACGLFVALAEEGEIKGDITDAVVKKYLQPYTNTVDCVLLGCTHFPVFKQAIHDFIGDDVFIVDSALETAKTVFEILNQKQLVADISRSQTTHFYVTDLPERFARVGEVFLEQCILTEKVEVVDGSKARPFR